MKTTFLPALRQIPIFWSVLMMATAFSSEPTAARYLRVSENHRFLVQEDGQPFFWLGDTAWELFHRLGKTDTEHYLKTRVQQGFNMVQCVLTGYSGLTVPTPEGHVPFVDLDPAQRSLLQAHRLGREQSGGTRCLSGDPSDLGHESARPRSIQRSQC